MTDEARRRSNWMLRVLEWDDARARYPNLWHAGMPAQVLAFDTVAMRLRLGDLVAVFSPLSVKHPERSERFVGIARVAGLRRSQDAGHFWVDFEPAHRFDPPLDLNEAPRRVFQCCDPGWPQADTVLFGRAFDAAVAAGFKPSREESEGPAAPQPAGPKRPDRPPRPTLAPEQTGGPESAQPRGRRFAGVSFSGALRDPKDATCIALAELRDDGRLALIRIDATGRSGLRDRLRDPDRELAHAEALGLDFPFGLPVPFAEALLGGPFPEEGWWALARRLEKVTFPDYLVALKDFRDANGETKRLTDEAAGSDSPLHRADHDLGPTTYHGIRLIAEERSRYAIRPFETARGRLLLEVNPGGSLRKLGLPAEAGAAGSDSAAIIEALFVCARLPVDLDEFTRGRCQSNRHALDAVLAARCAAAAVLSGEVDRPIDELAPGAAERVRREGWIYGVGEA